MNGTINHTASVDANQSYFLLDKLQSEFLNLATILIGVFGKRESFSESNGCLQESIEPNFRISFQESALLLLAGDLQM